MAAPVPWACCAVLAAAAAVVYTQRHSPQEAPHVQYERLGSDVTLPCGTANWDAAVTWRVNGTDLAPDLLNGSQLVLRGLELGHSGLYACFHRDSWHLRHQVLLHVGLPPREPVLSCRSNTYPKGFYCSWHLPTPTYIPNTFNVTVLHGSKIMVCEKDPALKNRCHIRYMHLFSTIKYKVSISVSNALGHNATAITFDEFTIVKPDPPENVVARPVPSNPRRLEVTWQTPSTWPDPESFPLKFFLRYRPLILDQWQHGHRPRGLGGASRFTWTQLPTHESAYSQPVRWNCPMAQHTPSQMPTLGRSTSSRWRPRTMRSGRGVTGAWPPMPHPGLRSHDTSPLRPRPRRPRPAPPAHWRPRPPRRSVTPGSWAAGEGPRHPS
uniref:Ciliary neurotrophic factor receptor subunit alpha n=1 Tax=Equus caballus TaxID=9796 RepID=A0A9L0TLU5_HORSE